MMTEQATVNTLLKSCSHKQPDVNGYKLILPLWEKLKQNKLVVDVLIYEELGAEGQSLDVKLHPFFKLEDEYVLIAASSDDLALHTDGIA